MIRHRHGSVPATGWRRLVWTLPAIMAICIAGPASAQNVDTATYNVTFTGNWTDASTTPTGDLPGSAHFTTLIGAIHNSSVSFWSVGGTATPGVESMAEIGGTSTLRAEIQASPHHHAVIQQGVSFGGTGTATFSINVPEDHPLITLSSMIGPSPDWFVGISGRSLLDGQGNWQARVDINLYPYDAGTEDGDTFSLSNPNTNPQGTITRLRGVAPFTNAHMATLSFVLDTTSQPPGQVTGVSVTPGTGVLNVSWNSVAGADSYKVQWRSGGQNFGSARQRVVTGSQVTIPNLIPGVQYSVRVIATSNENGDGTPSSVESGTPLAAANEPPETTTAIAMQFLSVGGSARINLSNHFRDPEGNAMTFSAVSDNTGTVTATVQGSVLTVRGVARGGASVTVTARDNGGLTASQSFRAMVGRVAFFTATSASAPEGGTTRLTVRLSRSMTAATSLGYVFGTDSNPNTRDADATDYHGTGGTIAIPAGQTDADIEITIRDDSDIEPAREVFTVAIVVPAQHRNDIALGAATATVTINEGVCDRTPEVRDALRRTAACSAVSTVDLNRRRSLTLADMGIDALQPSDLDYLPSLRNLDISGNRLQTLPPGMLSGLTNLVTLRLHGNRLAALGDGFFNRVAGLTELQLHDNPGAPFVLTLELARTDAAVEAPGPATVVASVAKGAPFTMRGSVSASNGELSADSVAILPGATEAAPITVTQVEEGAVRVTLEAAPPIPTTLCGADRHPCFRGIATAAGPPLVLFKKPLRATDTPPTLELLADGDAVEVDLTTLFTGSEGETLTYVVESSDPELVAVRVDGTNLVLLPNAHGEGGTATVTVIATDEDDLTATLSFVITIEPNPRGFLRGWRKGLFEE